MTGPALSREIVAMIADRADWLVDAVACSTQNRMFLRGEKECDTEACGSILLNGKQAITQVAQAQAAELERLRAERDVLTKPRIVILPDGYYGVCIGGRWDGWMMFRGANGQWVSNHKMPDCDPSLKGGTQ